jgi:hypothetical protein
MLTRRQDIVTHDENASIVARIRYKLSSCFVELTKRGILKSAPDNLDEHFFLHSD